MLHFDITVDTHYLADIELGFVGFPHCVIDECSHELFDKVKIVGPGFLHRWKHTGDT